MSAAKNGENVIHHNDGTFTEMSDEAVTEAVASAISMVFNYLAVPASSNKKRDATSDAEDIDEDASPSDAKRISPKTDSSDEVDELPVSLTGYTKFPADSKSAIWTSENYPKPAGGNILIYSIDQSTSCTNMEPVTMFLVPAEELEDSEWETLLIAKSFLYTIKDQISGCFGLKEDREKMKETFIGTAKTDSKLSILLTDLAEYRIPDSSIPDHSTVVFSMVTGFIGQ